MGVVERISRCRSVEDVLRFHGVNVQYKSNVNNRKYSCTVHSKVRSSSGVHYSLTAGDPRTKETIDFTHEEQTTVVLIPVCPPCSVMPPRHPP